VVLSVLQIDDTDHPAPAHQRHGEKSLITVFGKFVEKLEARIMGGVLRDRHRFAVLRDPSRDSLPDAQFQAIDHFRMWVFRRPQDKFIAFEHIEEAGIALYKRGCKIDNPGKNFMESVCRVQTGRNFMQYVYM
jgi:hypothetical protein